MRGFCQTCNKEVKTEKEKINHLLHIFLTIVTGFAWGFVYLFHLFTQFDECTECGSRIVGPQNKGK